MKDGHEDAHKPQTILDARGCCSLLLCSRPSLHCNDLRIMVKRAKTQIVRDSYDVDGGDGSDGEGAVAVGVPRASAEQLAQRRIVRARVKTEEETRIAQMSSNNNNDAGSGGLFRNVFLAPPAAAPPAPSFRFSAPVAAPAPAAPVPAPVAARPAAPKPSPENLAKMRQLDAELQNLEKKCQEALLARGLEDNHLNLFRYAKALMRRRTLTRAQWRALQTPEALAAVTAPAPVTTNEPNPQANQASSAPSAPAPSAPFSTGTTSAPAASNVAVEENDDETQTEPTIAAAPNPDAADSDWEEIGRYERIQIYHRQLNEQEFLRFGTQTLRLQQLKTDTKQRRFIVYNSGETGKLLINMKVPEKHEFMSSRDKKNVEKGTIIFMGINIGDRGPEIFHMRAIAETARSLSAAMNA